MFTYPMKTRGQLYECYEDFRKNVLNIFRHDLDVLEWCPWAVGEHDIQVHQADNANEYEKLGLGRVISRKYGTHAQFTNAFNPQNGIAERRMRTIMERVRACGKADKTITDFDLVPSIKIEGNPLYTQPIYQSGMTVYATSSAIKLTRGARRFCSSDCVGAYFASEGDSQQLTPNSRSVISTSSQVKIISLAQDELNENVAASCNIPVSVAHYAPESSTNSFWTVIQSWPNPCHIVEKHPPTSVYFVQRISLGSNVSARQQTLQMRSRI
ncbi:Gag-pol [Phytophthora palmivora]|uniref:Gag-pol n=1 Tax=Phytophthora palmivora TaxID=4796 RepID=A0A2P4XV07_9STRA|nr:Gag-pol [Phytophthora palmivora]